MKFTFFAFPKNSRRAVLAALRKQAQHYDVTDIRVAFDNRMNYNPLLEAVMKSGDNRKEHTLIMAHMMGEAAQITQDTVFGAMFSEYRDVCLPACSQRDNPIKHLMAVYPDEAAFVKALWNAPQEEACGRQSNLTTDRYIGLSLGKS